MRIAIVGAGAIGCFLAARLSDHGHQVTLVGRLNQVNAITRDGLILREPRGSVRTFQLPAVTALHDQPDLILLTVKTQDVAQACQEMLPYAHGVPVVTMQNGLQADQIAGEILGHEAIVGAVVMCAVDYLKPGEVSVLFPGWLIAGEPFRAASPRAREIVQTLSEAVPAYLTKHLAQARWSKLIFNLNNALCAATGLSLPSVANTPAGRMLSIRVMKEGYRVARAAGTRPDRALYGLSPRAWRQDSNAALVSVLQGSMSTLLTVLPDRAGMAVLKAARGSRLNQIAIRGSTWQSIARGRPSEIDYLNGEIVRLGTLHGIPTPYNSHVVDMVRAVERSRSFCRLDDLVPPRLPRQANAPQADVPIVGEES